MCTVTSSNTPTCACKPGFFRDERFGCVDENPPVLHIRPAPSHTDPKTGITRLVQGEKYEEHGVDVIDDNAEEYLRSLKIAYSRPLPQGCLLEMGEFHVNYTVATPWTDPEFVRAKRTVVIENVNECRVKEDVGVGKYCPELVAMCDGESGAMCADEIGTYSCKCPVGTEGDGFLPIPRLKPDGKGGYVGSMIPLNYRGGTGCRDTSRPTIDIIGPNPKKFLVAKPSGLKSIMRMGEDKDTNASVERLLAEQRSHYENQIRFMIKSTSGAELCATTSKPNVRATDCIHAQDQTYKGVVDLSARVSVGEPIAKDGYPLQWKIPYNVIDDAGNKAKTVWRDIVVDEVDLNDFERKTKAEILANRKHEVDDAVNSALIQERKRVGANGNNKSRSCPACEPCVCKGTNQNAGTLTAAECNSICEMKVAGVLARESGNEGTTCTPDVISSRRVSGHRWVEDILDSLEEMLGASTLILLLMGCTLATMLYVLQRLITALFASRGPDTRTYYHSADDAEREKIMAQNVSYYRSPSSTKENRQSTPGSGAASSVPLPPTASLSSQRNGVFSPHEKRTNKVGAQSQQRQGETSQYSSPFRTEDGTDSIYQTMPPITPLRNDNAGRYNLRSNN